MGVGTGARGAAAPLRFGQNEKKIWAKRRKIRTKKKENE